MPLKDWITMKRLTALFALLLAASVYAEIYQWKDENGRTIISDKPPVGSARIQKKIDTESTPGKAAPAQKTLADREMEFRKRQKESQEADEKSKKEQSASTEKNENCENARRQLQALESGERIALRDDKGERYYMDDAQRAQEITKTKQAVQSSCK